MPRLLYNPPSAMRRSSASQMTEYIYEHVSLLLLFIILIVILSCRVPHPSNVMTTTSNARPMSKGQSDPTYAEMLSGRSEEGSYDR